jgi:hypothetical protein
MRLALATVLLAATLAFSAPVRAQLRADLPGQAPATVYAAPGTPTLASLFNAQTLRFSHSYEMSYSSLGGASLGMGVYTTSLRWQPTERLAGRVDVGVAHSPFGDDGVRSALGFDQDTPARVFLRNAELAYRPTANSIIHLQVRQSPFGAYASPYGYGYDAYSPMYGTGLHARYGSDSDALFWRDGQ